MALGPHPQWSSLIDNSHCDEWTVDNRTAYMFMGSVTATDATFTQECRALTNCAVETSIYCFEQ